MLGRPDRIETSGNGNRRPSIKPSHHEPRLQPALRAIMQRERRVHRKRELPRDHAAEPYPRPDLVRRTQSSAATASAAAAAIKDPANE
jgi:hypothetical protein